MNGDSSTETPASRTEQTDDTSRRRFLKGTAAAGVAAAGIGVASSGASAQFFGAETISLSDSGDGFTADGSLPVADEVLVFVHGWFGNIAVGSQASSVSGSLESAGFSPDETVGIQWPASNINIGGAMGDTERVGETVAELAQDFYDAGGGNVRLVGHSLGGRCVYWAMTKLADGYELETVAGVGAAGTSMELCGDPWNPGFENTCDVRNYYSGNDSVIGGSFAAVPGSALGAEGTDCDPAPNFADVDVTDDVSNHLGYLGSSAVGNDLAQAIQSESCESSADGTGGSSGDGSSDSAGGGWFGSGGSTGDTGGSDDGGSSGGWW